MALGKVRTDAFNLACRLLAIAEKLILLAIPVDAYLSGSANAGGRAGARRLSVWASPWRRDAPLQAWERSARKHGAMRRATTKAPCPVFPCQQATATARCLRPCPGPAGHDPRFEMTSAARGASWTMGTGSAIPGQARVKYVQNNLKKKKIKKIET